MEWLKELNKEQLQAVLSTEGPLLVLAGAGSGKTKVITYRIAYILSMGLAKPHNILAITFTNKAADEMKERIKRLISIESFSEMWVSTFHAACARILRIEAQNIGFSNNFVIFDTHDRDSILKECYKKLNIDEDRLELRYVSRMISNLKNMLISPYDAEKDLTTYDKRIIEIYKQYNKMLKDNNAFDFDDLIYYTIELFKNNPDILEKYQQKFKYILVDEYQDTNHAQFYLIYLLSQKYKNICVVGDDDQSIYGFRGADVKNILQFEKIFPDTKIIKLEKNYRSTKTILSAANEVIKHNINRKGKNLWTDNQDGSPIFIYQAFDEIDEAEFVAKSVKNLILNGVSPSQIGILYRTNAQSLNFENALSSFSIAYKVVGALRFYERKEIKDIIAYLRLINNPKDNLSFYRVINVPKRGIGSTTVEKIRALAEDYNICAYELIKKRGEFEFDKKTFLKLSNFIELIDELIYKSQQKTIVEIINLVLENTNYLQMLSSSKSEEDFQRIKNIEQLVSAASIFEEQNEDKTLQNFLNSIALSSDEEGDEKDDKVMLLTVHAAKGLEFDIVFLTGLEEGLFPLVKMNDIEDAIKELEEERRLCYVAITRAKKHLILTFANNRRIYGRLHSRLRSTFIEEIPERILLPVYTPISNNLMYNDIKTTNLEVKNINHLSVGDKIEHNKFGIGKIVSISKDMSEAIIDFENFGQKRLLLSYANLRKIG